MKKKIALLLTILVFAFCSFTKATLAEIKALQEISSPIFYQYQTGGIKAAEKEYKNIIKNKNDDEYTYIAMIVIYKTEKKYNKAIEICLKGLEKHPNSHMIYNYLGSSYGEIASYDEAIWAYSESIKIEPSEPPYYNRGKLWAKVKNNHQNAIADFTKALECLEEYKNNPKVYNNMASDIYWERSKSYMEIGDFKQAISDFDTQIKLNSSDAYVYFERSRAKILKLMEDGKKDKVTSAIQNATIKSAFNDLDLAMKYFRLNNNVEMYNKALEMKNGLYRIFSSKGK